jgi:hypothetical protein
VLALRAAMLPKLEIADA